MNFGGVVNKKNRIVELSWRRQFFYGLIITSIILLFPFLNFIHLLFNVESNKLMIFGYVIDHGYPDNQVFAWFLISNFISLFYLSIVLWLSFGFWRNFLMPAILYFATYPIWMFSSNYEFYFSFLSSFYGITVIIVTLLLVKLLDSYLKDKLFKRYISLSFNQIFKEIFFSKNSKFNRQILKTIKERANLSLKEYSCRLYYYSEVAHSNYTSHYYLGSMRALQRNNKLNYFIGSYILLITILLFVDKAIPNNIHEIDFLGWQIGSFGFKDIGTLFYYASQKLVICIILIVWFITCEFWWRWAILSPIIFYSYQFWESFQPVDDIDGFGNLNVFPLIFLTILGVFLLSKVIRRISINLDYQVFLEEELEKSIGELSRLERRV